MATESPLIHDGSQTTAATDLSTSGALAGSASSGQFLAVKLTAARSVNIANAGGEQIYGILQNRPQSGQAADVGILGVTKAMAGATVTGGNFLMTDTSGRLIPVTGTNHRVAVAIESAATTGIIFTVGLVGGGWTAT